VDVTAAWATIARRHSPHRLNSIAAVLFVTMSAIWRRKYNESGSIKENTHQRHGAAKHQRSVTW